MGRPNLSVDQIERIITEASEIRLLDQGGQKLVFTGIINGQKYALKFIAPDDQQQSGPIGEPIDVVIARAKREVETLRQCATEHLVKMGPIGLNSTTIHGENILYFSEEFIEGDNLINCLKKDGTFSAQELKNLALHISEAIESLWQYSKIHRDVKPGNIMRRTDGTFVLLDMGFVFDLKDASLSVGPVGTAIYFSPEQLNFDSRRTSMNFRSDLFSLGIVLYEMATGRHPFFTQTSRNQWDVVKNITNLKPAPINNFRTDIPNELEVIIFRLLSKRPAQRYRSIDFFQKAINKV